LSTTLQQTGTLYNVILTADFAISAPDHWPEPFTDPYLDVPENMRILSTNHTHEAWYCWTPDNPNQLSDGSYYVPGWSFGNIPPGQSATRLLSFIIEDQTPQGGIAQGDPRYDAIMNSDSSGSDILANRSLSLKISQWQDMLARDDGTAYPEPGYAFGDVSVFHESTGSVEPPPEPDYCFKWSQPPDGANGVDVESWGIGTNEEQWVSRFMVADDWLCDGRPVSGIRWWGSYKDWMTTNAAPAPPPELPIHPVAFLVSWHTDVPVSSSNLYSRPGEVIDWQAYPVGYSLQPMGEGIVQEEPWLVSELSFIEPGYYEHEYQYTLLFPATNQWIEKEGAIYWLGIQAVYPSPPVTNAWGWKTTDTAFNWNDDAVQVTAIPPGTNELIYPPPGWPAHPYKGESVNMAYQLITDVCPRRTRKWAQPPDMVKGVNMPAFYTEQEPSQQLIRADDWLCDGRRVTDIHWWGSYLDYYSDSNGPVAPPAPAPSKPVGFSIAWYTDVPTNITQAHSHPGELLASLFVPLTNCHEVYYGTVAQYWGPQGSTNYEHEFQYYVDLLDVGTPWLETNGVVYWLSIQAHFPIAPEQGGLHKGWGWKTTPLTNRWNDASVFSNAASPGWHPAVYPSGHPDAGVPCDLSFELTTDQPGSGTNWWNQSVVIREYTVPTNAPHKFGSVGDAGAGVQILQYCTNLLDTNWVNLATNTLPLPAPYTNYWQNSPGSAPIRFYRIMQK